MFYCAPCGRRFANENDLQKHINSSLRHVDDKRHRHLQSFIDSTELARYEAIHTGYEGLHWNSAALTFPENASSHTEYQYPCNECWPMCGRIFSDLDTLETHLQFMAEKRELDLIRKNKNMWSAQLPDTFGSITKLQEMVHSKGVLEKNLYLTEPPSAQGISNQRKCKDCKVKYFKLQNSDLGCKYHPGRGRKKWAQARRKLEIIFDCCGGRERCTPRDGHIFEDIETLAQHLAFAETPQPSYQTPKRKAVVLDCEMGRSITNSSELIQLSVVDYLTGEVLIDSIVRPKAKIASYNTPWSGITHEMMRRAIAEGEFLESFEGARAELWKWIDSKTILVGHSLNHDLNQLHLIHPLIVDSFICVPKLRSSGNSLKNLARDLLGKDIQGGLGAKRGHDCVEDALAARELVIWCSNNAAALNVRALQGKEEEEIALRKTEAQRAEKEQLVKEAQERLARLAVLADRGKGYSLANPPMAE